MATTYKIQYIGLDHEVVEVVTLHNLDGDHTMMQILLNNMEVRGIPYAKVLRYNETLGAYENVSKEVFAMNRDRMIKIIKNAIKEDK